MYIHKLLWILCCYHSRIIQIFVIFYFFVCFWLDEFRDMPPIFLYFLPAFREIQSNLQSGRNELLCKKKKRIATPKETEQTKPTDLGCTGDFHGSFTPTYEHDILGEVTITIKQIHMNSLSLDVDYNYYQRNLFILDFHTKLI